MTEADRPLYGLAAEFDGVDALTEAYGTLRSRGFTRIDVYSPFPLPDLAEDMGVRTGIIPWIAGVAGLVGAIVQYGSQVWMNAIDYPLNVGGRPLHSWPAFIPATIIVAVLWAGAATLIGLLLILRLPRLHHPVFTVPGFERATQNRFFLCLKADDPRFPADDVRNLFSGLHPVSIHEVPA
jgi:hypothetical protein